jgi:hypothetical protein
MITRVATILIIGSVLVGLAAAQQPNTPGLADLRINGEGAVGPYPYSANLPRGTTQSVVLLGLPNAPFSLAAAGSVLPSGLPLLGGLLDIDRNSGFTYVFDGLNDPSVRLNAGGFFIAGVPFPSTAALGASAALQAVVADPTNTPHGARFTACCVATVAEPIVPVPITFTGFEPGRPGTLFDLGPYGLSLPFYANTYSSVYVNSDGLVSFGGNSTDFTPTPEEFRSGPARAAPMWTDLDPGHLGAVVQVSVDTVGGAFASPQPGIRIDWIQMAEWSNVGLRHTFRMDIDVLGDIQVSHDPSNGAMLYDELMGITPGTGLLPPAPNNQWSAQKDLSALPGNPITGLPNEAFWEWFGISGGAMPFYTAGFNNPWDMAGTVTRFLAVGAGATGAHYIGS